MVFGVSPYCGYRRSHILDRRRALIFFIYSMSDLKDRMRNQLGGIERQIPIIELSADIACVTWCFLGVVENKD